MEKNKRRFINPKKESLTIEKLRGNDSKYCSGEKAQIKALSKILVDQMLEENQIKGKEM